jgi:hypothetical protein
MVMPGAPPRISTGVPFNLIEWAWSESSSAWWLRC